VNILSIWLNVNTTTMSGVRPKAPIRIAGRLKNLIKRAITKMVGDEGFGPIKPMSGLYVDSSEAS
jgi:hypothetical protein